MCYDRIPMGGGSCFGVTDPSELRPLFREVSERVHAPERIIRWEVRHGDFVIGSVREVTLGKFKAFLGPLTLPIDGDFRSYEEAKQTVFAEDAKPPF